MKDRELLKPMVKLVGNMHGNGAVHIIIYTVSTHYLQSIHYLHPVTLSTQYLLYLGNEAVGRELLLELAGLLLTGSEEPRLSRILATTDLHILVSLNPDGFERSSEGSCDKNEEGRRNANNVATHNTKYV